MPWQTGLLQMRCHSLGQSRPLSILGCWRSWKGYDNPKSLYWPEAGRDLWLDLLKRRRQTTVKEAPTEAAYMAMSRVTTNGPAAATAKISHSIQRESSSRML